MKKEIRTNSGKIVELPSRMFRQNDLDEMNIDCVNKKIFLNKIYYGEKLPLLDSQIKNNMVIIDYIDCSKINFSEEALQEIVKKQLNSEGDFIFLPHFKNETEFDVHKKLKTSEVLRSYTHKEIILEISYKSPISLDELKDKIDAFDHLAIFYGVHFGRFPSFYLLCQKIYNFKVQTGKKVFCTGVPFLFSGDQYNKGSYLLPIWGLICDGWIKHWGIGGPQKEIRLVDSKDYKKKNYMGWLEKGHTPNEIVPQVNATVYSIFRKDSKEAEEARKIYTMQLLDESLIEVDNITPFEIENYILLRAPPQYQYLIMQLYKEKLIQYEIKESNWIKPFVQEDKRLIEQMFRRQILSPAILEQKVLEIKELLKVHVELTVTDIIKVLKPSERNEGVSEKNR